MTWFYKSIANNTVALLETKIDIYHLYFLTRNACAWSSNVTNAARYRYVCFLNALIVHVLMFLIFKYINSKTANPVSLRYHGGIQAF